MVVDSAARGRTSQFVLREDTIRFPDGVEALYAVVENPNSAFIVPYFANGDTMLVRQWRHAWDMSSWEVPAGTFDGDEEPLACARRELAEETGLVAQRYLQLGVVHGAAFLSGRAHLFLAEEAQVPEVQDRRVRPPLRHTSRTWRWSACPSPRRGARRSTGRSSTPGRLRRCAAPPTP